MRVQMVLGNWKMHGSLVGNKTLLDGVLAGLTEVDSVTCGVCVPSPYLFQAQFILQGSPVLWGAQNVSQHEKGAYTGEISVSMLRDLGCSLTLVGHSERRAIYGESDATVAEKFVAAQKAGIKPVLCVGETLEEREKNITNDVVKRQIMAVVEKAGFEAMKDCVLAYEPVWAIGTGKTASPQQAQDVHAFIRGLFAEKDAELAQNLTILYGGSVKASNAAELFSMPDIDGGLIGGASLDTTEFVAICKAAQPKAA